jgi:hypothetical protein
MYQYECHIFEVLCLSSHLAPTCAQKEIPMTPQIALEIQGEIGPCAGENGGYTYLFLPMLQKRNLHGQRA